MGETVADEMISVPIGLDMRMAVVGSPAYLASQGIPHTPQDLTAHNCIKLRLPTHGGLYAWEFEKDGRELSVRVDGQLIFGTSQMMMLQAKAWLGLAYLTEQQVAQDLESGCLVRVLEEWCLPFPGYHLYYPSRRQTTQAFTLLVEALRYRRDPWQPSYT